MRSVQTMVILLGVGAVGLEAQYQGRAGVRYMDPGQTFQVRRTNDWSPDRRDGRCRIRVRIDDDSDVELYGETIRIRPIRGGPGRDEGSECNAPLPTSGMISNFRFRGIDGRGNPRLVQEPGQRNYHVAVVNVQDPRGGDEGYTFELSWNWDGSTSGGGGFFPNDPPNNFPPNSRPWPPPSSGNRPNPGYLPDMNVSMVANGNLNDGTQNYRVRDARIQIRNGECRLGVETDQGNRFDMWGQVDSYRQDTCRLDGSTQGPINAEARILRRGNRPYGFSAGGRLDGGRQFSVMARGRN